MLKTIIKRLNNRYNKLMLYKECEAILSKNKKLNNIHAGKRCFIMGTGPSIKDQNLLKLKDEFTFVVNSFFKHPDFKNIKPKFYVALDIDHTKSPNKNNDLTKKFIENSESLNKAVPISFFNISAKNMIEENNLFPSQNVHYLVSDGFFDENSKFNLDISKPIPNTKNIIIGCVLIAVYMGFKEIYLLGCEHDFLAYPTNYEWSPHFYKNDDFDVNNPEDAKKYNLTVASYETAITHAGRLFRNYRLLKEGLAKEKPEVKIYNATPNSFLDVFPFVKYEDLVS